MTSRKTGLLRLRHLREVTEAVEEEMVVERERFTRLAKDTAKTRAVSAFNLFQTPENVAKMMADMLDLSGRILEPSAGLGSLYRAARGAGHITLVEQSPECCEELYREIAGDENAVLIQGDFMLREGLGKFDSVIMNPPFKNGTDIKHIKRAMGMIADGGRLVSLCASGPRQNKQLRPLASEWLELPPGSFSGEGTNVSVAVFVYQKGRL